MKFVYNDGGRSEAGFKGEAGDCVTRAIAIAAELPYRQIYDELNGLAKEMNKRSSARTGVHRKVYDRYLKQLGWQWTPTMTIGSGCQVHLRADELPNGRIIVRLSKHVCAVVDGTVQDTHDCTRDGKRAVYGYYRK